MFPSKVFPAGQGDDFPDGNLHKVTSGGAIEATCTGHNVQLSSLINIFYALGIPTFSTTTLQPL